MQKDNITIVTSKFFRLNNLNISSQTIYEELLKHPDYPSLLAVSDVLANFNIQNGAFRVTIDDLYSIPCPFIAHTNINNGDFLIINKIDGEKVTVSNEKLHKHRLNNGEFNKIYTGVVLTAEPAAKKKSNFPAPWQHLNYP